MENRFPDAIPLDSLPQGQTEAATPAVPFSDAIPLDKLPGAPEPVAPRIGYGESFGRGAEQMVTLGHAPQVNAAFNKVFRGGDYKSNLAEQSARQDAAWDQNPWSYGGGATAGALVPAAATILSGGTAAPEELAIAGAGGAGRSLVQKALGVAGSALNPVGGAGRSLATRVVGPRIAGALTGTAAQGAIYGTANSDAPTSMDSAERFAGDATLGVLGAKVGEKVLSPILSKAAPAFNKALSMFQSKNITPEMDAAIQRVTGGLASKADFSPDAEQKFMQIINQKGFHDPAVKEGIFNALGLEPSHQQFSGVAAPKAAFEKVAETVKYNNDKIQQMTKNLAGSEDAGMTNLLHAAHDINNRKPDFISQGHSVLGGLPKYAARAGAAYLGYKFGEFPGATAAYLTEKYLENLQGALAIAKEAAGAQPLGLSDADRLGMMAGAGYASQPHPAIKQVAGWLGLRAGNSLGEDFGNAVDRFTGKTQDREHHASGGKVDGDLHEKLVQRLMNMTKQAKKVSDKTTEPLLNAPDEAIVKALGVAQEAI